MPEIIEWHPLHWYSRKEERGEREEMGASRSLSEGSGRSGRLNQEEGEKKEGMGRLKVTLNAAYGSADSRKFRIGIHGCSSIHPFSLNGRKGGGGEESQAS